MKIIAESSQITEFKVLVLMPVSNQTKNHKLRDAYYIKDFMVDEWGTLVYYEFPPSLSLPLAVTGPHNPQLLYDTIPCILNVYF